MAKSDQIEIAHTHRPACWQRSLCPQPGTTEKMAKFHITANCVFSWSVHFKSC